MNEAKIEGTSALVLDTVGTEQLATRPPEEAKLDREVSLIEQRASSVVITSDVDFAAAGEMTKQVKEMQKQVTDYWEPMRKSTYDAYTAVNQHKKEMLDPLAKAEKILKTKMSDYSKEQERIRREQEEARRRAAQEEFERKMAEATEAEANGDALGAEMAMAEAEVAEGIVVGNVQAQPPKVKGVTQTKTWKITGIDKAKVPVEFAGMELRPVDEKLVLQLIKASKGKIAIPGVTYEEDLIIGIR